MTTIATCQASNDNNVAFSGACSKFAFFLDAFQDAMNEAKLYLDTHEVEDHKGGSNFDSVGIRCRKNQGLEKALDFLSLPYYRSRSGAYIISPRVSGQGAVRTQACKVMVSVLKCTLYKLDAFVDYNAD